MEFRLVLFNRNIMQATKVSHICDFELSGNCIKKGKKKLVKFILIMYFSKPIYLKECIALTLLMGM